MHIVFPFTENHAWIRTLCSVTNPCEIRKHDYNKLSGSYTLWQRTCEMFWNRD